MKTSTIVWIVLIIIVLGGGAWYWYAYGNGATMTPSGQTTTTNTNSTGTAGQSSAVVQPSSSPTLGSYLAAAPSGLTLYAYANDTAGVSNCTGQCAVNWRPYIVDATAALSAASGINGALGTTVRADGTTQLTYNGAPVYTYIKDSKPGDTNGNGVNGVWSIVKP